MRVFLIYSVKMITMKSVLLEENLPMHRNAVVVWRIDLHYVVDLHHHKCSMQNA